jgi:hypothetical protein
MCLAAADKELGQRSAVESASALLMCLEHDRGAAFSRSSLVRRFKENRRVIADGRQLLVYLISAKRRGTRLDG